jgi:colanic acid biosynthesis glycosyl transferase WcaI
VSPGYAGQRSIARAAASPGWQGLTAKKVAQSMRAKSIVAVSSDAAEAMPSIALVGINYEPEVTGIGVYSSGMAKYLASHGHAVTVYTGVPYYPHWQKTRQDRGILYREEQAQGVSVRRSYVFVPRTPTVLKRILHELSFVASATLNYLAGPTADITIIVSPPLLLGLPLACLARAKGSLTLFHVQDLQPDAAVDLGMLPRGLLVRALFLLERATYRIAHVVSAISPGMLARIEAKGVPPNKLLLLRNWSQDVAVQPRSRDTRYRRNWGLGEKFVVLYSGNMGVKQGLATLLEAAHLLRAREDIAFVVVGDGGEKAALIQASYTLGMSNLQFRPLQPQQDLADLLATADISVVPQRPGVSDIVLPSKIANIMGSGRPLVAAAAPDTDLHRIVVQTGCGVIVAPGDASALAEAILALVADPKMRERMGRRGRRYVDRALSESAILSEFARWIRHRHSALKPAIR